MGCNCKNSSEEQINNESVKPVIKLKLVNIILNSILYLILLVVTIPIVILFTGYVLFKGIVLKDSNINMMSMYFNMVKKLTKKEEEEVVGESFNSESEIEEYQLMDIESVDRN